MDGSGFSRGIAWECDSSAGTRVERCRLLLSLVDPGSGRPAILPHDALGFLLHEGARGQREILPLKALLKTITLFPIGSRVELDDGREATVIRRNEDHYAGPVVHRDATAENTILAIHQSQHKIVRPLVDQAKREMRIMPDMMDSLTLDMLQPGCEELPACESLSSGLPKNLKRTDTEGAELECDRNPRAQRILV